MTKRLVLMAALVSAGCSKEEMTSTVENGVRVNYVSKPAVCAFAGNDKDACRMDTDKTGPGLRTSDSWACGSATTRTGGSNAPEYLCFVTLTTCQEFVAGIRKSIADGAPELADATAVKGCEIYRVRKQ